MSALASRGQQSSQPAAAVLCVGGTDCSGGAGLSRDSAMAARMGCLAKPVVSAITVQTETGVQAVQPTPTELLIAQFTAALSAPMPRAIKIGMLANSDQINALAAHLPIGMPVVLDPVLRASSGGALTPTEALAPLLRRCDLLTPNLPEAADLTGIADDGTEESRTRMATALLALGPKAVLLKGGHGSGARSTDTLYTADNVQYFSAPRLTGQWRGTGCRLASAIACGLARGETMATACSTGKAALYTWLTEC